MTATLAPEARRNVELFFGSNFQTEFKPKMTFGKSKNDAGAEVDALFLTDVPVFRSGTFRDSVGFLHTWESIHMDQMVAHFDMLKNRKILEDIPVRKGHGSFLTDPMDSLIGWHTALRTKEMKNPSDQQDYIYILADYTILDPEAMQKIPSGLWKNRSAEVGSYVTNSEAEFWPCYLGFAYVDFSAVEGLNAFSQSPDLGTKFSLMFEDEKEAPVAGTTTTEGQPAQVTTPVSAAPVIPVPTPPVTPLTAAPVVAPPALHAGQVAPATFSINGQATSDFAAVQTHISTLELFQRETRESGRKDFIKSLAATSKISAAQIPSLEKFALGLSDEQWTEYSASWDAAPTNSTLGLHAGSGQVQNHPANAVLDDQITIAEGVIKQFRSSGKTQAQIEKMDVFTRLNDLRAQRAQAQS